MKVAFDPNMPIYIQIMDFIKKQIITGQLQQGEKLPSVRDLAAELQTNPNTVQRALQELEREGIAEARRGMGRYVTHEGEKIMEMKRDMSKELISAFVSGMEALGVSEEEMLMLVQSALEQRKGEAR
ncbi:GntR family transcriptional regulator [Ectobacillus ponti]|uniref:GntR family transcriptional regulator n=1 Tax=Ectobacillus ponti TaxID=2961894 RepID=A0AA41X403_9BACI|nr:GntR family transcriptional regulator [Ectobacillus ponti]MCP8968549.1 GntR family transcriptional regulator [Ectobacillus ponti]